MSKILLGAEDARTLDRLAPALREAGHEVVLVEDGDELIDELGTTWMEEGEEPFSLIVIDLWLGGLELFVEVREFDEEQPILAIAWDGVDGLRDDLFELGVAVCERPRVIQELEAWVEQLVQRRAA